MYNALKYSVQIGSLYIISSEREREIEITLHCCCCCCYCSTPFRHHRSGQRGISDRQSAHFLIMLCVRSSSWPIAAKETHFTDSETMREKKKKIANRKCRFICNKARAAHNNSMCYYVRMRMWINGHWPFWDSIQWHTHTHTNGHQWEMRIRK